MLECCAVGVAMGSGGDEIKAMADYITDDVDKDGLYKAFEHFNLIWFYEATEIPITFMISPNTQQIQ